VTDFSRHIVLVVVRGSRSLLEGSPSEAADKGSFEVGFLEKTAVDSESNFSCPSLEETEVEAY
jgi:hypothetical protein